VSLRQAQAGVRLRRIEPPA